MRLEFHIVEINILFARMRIDVVVIDISFADFMCKFRHSDKSWVNN